MRASPVLQIFDYEYDSDEDWEEEEPGESLSDSEVRTQFRHHLRQQLYSV